MKEDDADREAQGGTEDHTEIQELPEEEIIRLRSELEAKAKEAEENYDRFLRTRAELENYKKRVEKEKADIRTFANESILSEILPVIDNFERAFSHANQENIESLKTGVKLTIDQMVALLKKFGLEEIKSVGEKFDPAVHHAISYEDAEKVEPGMVINEFQKGYFLKGRLLRPAMVSVAKAPEGGHETRH